MFRLGSPSANELERYLASAREATPNFGHIGATRSASPLDGFRFDEYRRVVGRGARDWEKAKDGLRAWVGQNSQGLTVTPANAPLAPDQTVVISGPVLGPLSVIIPCRVAYVVDEPNEFGFAYVTLDGHPECGEEAFLLSHEVDDSIVFRVPSFSRPAELLAQLGGPVTRAMQQRTNRAYLEGMQRFVRG